MNKVVHFEIPANDVKRAVEFYQKTFGWNIEKTPMPDMDYYMARTVETDQDGMPKTPGAINGGIMKRNTPTDQPVIVISVSNLDDHLVKAKEHGAQVVMEKMTVGDMGYYARITDTEGNVIGVWEDMK